MKTEDTIRPDSRLPSSYGIADVPIDAEILYSRCLGNVSLAMALIGELESSGTQQVDAVLRSAAAGDIAQTAEGAHALKGATAIVGARALSAKAAQVESVGRGGKVEELSNLLVELEEEMSRCVSSFQHTETAPTVAAKPVNASEWTGWRSAELFAATFLAVTSTLILIQTSFAMVT